VPSTFRSTLGASEGHNPARMNIFGIGPLELMLIAVVALIVFGPQKLPEIMGNIGRAVAEFRKVTGELSSEFNRTIQAEIDQTRAVVDSTRAVVDGTVASVGAPRPTVPQPASVPATVGAAVTTNGVAAATVPAPAPPSPAPSIPAPTWSAPSATKSVLEAPTRRASTAADDLLPPY
jgi:sec-independent protein translocase protein TatB